MKLYGNVSNLSFGSFCELIIRSDDIDHYIDSNMSEFAKKNCILATGIFKKSPKILKMF